VREAARKDSELKFTALMHHIDEALLLVRFPRKNGDGLRGSVRTKQADVKEETDLHRGVPAGCRRAIEGKREAA